MMLLLIAIIDISLMLAQVYLISKKKSLFVASNSDPKEVNPKENFFDTIYKDFVIKRVSASRMINSDASGRGAISELMISNVVNV